MQGIGMNNSGVYQGGGYSQGQGRVVGLDLLRISLALLIYMFHSTMHMRCYYSFLNPFIGVGAIAMTGFFLLSGYSLRLASGEHELIEKHNLGRFYLRRILSIVPLYYLFSILYMLFLGKESIADNLILFPIEALGMQSTFSSISHISHNGGTWFVSCIILAYAVYPLMQTICKQLKAKYKVLSLIVLVFIDIWGVVVSQRFDTMGIYDNPFYRTIEVACGMLVADINISYDNKVLQVLRSRGMLIGSIVILIGSVSCLKYFYHIRDYMQYNIIVLPCFITMLFALGSLQMPRLEKSRSITYFSKISYAFFLSQFFVYQIGKWVLNEVGWFDYNWAKILVTFTFCVISSIIAYEFVQRPINDLVIKVDR